MNSVAAIDVGDSDEAGRVVGAGFKPALTGGSKVWFGGATGLKSSASDVGEAGPCVWSRPAFPSACRLRRNQAACRWDGHTRFACRRGHAAIFDGHSPLRCQRCMPRRLDSAP